MIRRPFSAALLVLFLAACRGESPTAPTYESPRFTAQGANVHRISVAPDPIVLRPGETKTVTVSAEWTFALPVGFRSRDSAVATVSADKLAPGYQTTTITVTGVSAGQTELWDEVPNFARPPGSAFVTTIHVREPVRRRSTRS